MIIVLDTSAAIEMVLNRSQSEIFKYYISRCSKVITSDLYKAEATNVIWKYIKTGLISKEAGSHILNLALSIVDEYYDISEFTTEALHESVRLNHSSSDMLYFILARRTDAILMTLDKKLSKIATREGIETISSIQNTEF